MSQNAPLTSPDCLFCRIVAGEVPADVVLSTDAVVAFRDIAPQAPVHVLVATRDHHADVAQLAAADPALLAELVRTANEVAEDLADGQFRLDLQHRHARRAVGLPRARPRDRRRPARLDTRLSSPRRCRGGPLG